MEEYKDAYLKFSKEESLIFKKEEVYEKLAILEYEGLCNSPEFLHQISVLDIINEVYRAKVDNSDYLLIELIYACAHIKNELLNSNIKDEESISHRRNDLSYRNLFNLLFNKTMVILERLGNNDSIKAFSTLKYSEKMSSNQIDFDKYINEDINRSYLSMIQEAIENSKEDKQRKELIEAKYKLIFLNESIESEMIQRNFIIDKVVPLKASLYINYMDISDDKICDLFDNIVLNNLLRNKNFILKNTKIDRKSNKLELLLRSCYMRANLFLVNEESIIRDNIMYYEAVSKRNNSSECIKGDILITDTYSNALKDKVKYKALNIK